jgi:putative flippase GtrA
MTPFGRLPRDCPCAKSRARFAAQFERIASERHQAGSLRPWANRRANSGFRRDRPHRLFRRRRDHLPWRQYGGLSPELARPPGFIVATIVNFTLNRSITFRHSDAPLFRAFLRYCGVASVGLAVNYSVYSACVLLAPRAGFAVTPAILPLFVAAGSGAAMVLTFLGFRFFAFRP